LTSPRTPTILADGKILQRITEASASITFTIGKAQRHVARHVEGLGSGLIELRERSDVRV